MTLRITGIVIVLLAVGVFVGCTSDKQSVNDTEPSQTVGEEVTSADSPSGGDTLVARNDTISQILLDPGTAEDLSAREHFTEESFYTSGRLKERREMCVHELGDTVRDGLVETWYAEGQKKSAITYANDRINGEMVNWHKNGQTATRTQYVNGAKHGPARSWYENGQLRNEGEYVNDLQHGVWMVYYDDGKVRQKTEMRYGLLEGTRTMWHHNGSRRSYGEFRNNKLVSNFYEYDEDGNVTRIVEPYQMTEEGVPPAPAQPGAGS
jgi:antitoxin component YwqK of YwqJK toxin-antitoxin module